MNTLIRRLGTLVVSLAFLTTTGTTDAEVQPATSTANAVEASDSHCRCQGGHGPRVAHIREVLSQPLMSQGLDFTDEPLENIVSFLQSEYKIPVKLDLPALEDAGLAANEHCTVNVQDVSLGSALRILLRQKTLTYMVRDEVLIITTPEEAESELVACVYDVRDLVAVDDGKKDFDAVINMIVSCVASETWAENGGGEAEIRPLQPGLLVISQTQAVHDEIGGLLGLIRETLGDSAHGVTTSLQSAPPLAAVDPNLATEPAVPVKPTPASGSASK